MTDRISRFARRRTSRTLDLMARDWAIINAVWEYRWLRRCDLTALLDLPSASVANLRLRGLYDTQHLDRIRAGTVSAGLVPIYVVGEAGVPLVATMTGTPERDVHHRICQDRKASPIVLPHDLLANTIRIALTRAVAAEPQVILDCWLDAAASFDRYAPSHSLRPDGYFRLCADGLVYSYFLEVDNGTTDLTRWRAKCEGYLDYRERGAYAARFGLNRFRVVTTAPNLTRLEALRRTTRSVTDRSFWFALADEILTHGCPYQPIWRQLDSDRMRSLVEEGR